MGVTEGIKESMEDIVAQKTLLDKKRTFSIPHCLLVTEDVKIKL